jgi:hypothetical protein
VTASSTLVETVQATNVAVAGQMFGNIYQGDVRRPVDSILDFDLDAATRGFVGRAEVFDRLDSFAKQHPNGYFEIVAEAGLGKTALAAEIARRRQAIAFLTSASSGVQRPEQFLSHASGSLIARYKLDHQTLPARVGEDSTYLVRILRESVQRTGGEPIWLVVDGLDEALQAPPGSNPLLLPLDLPVGVYVVVTRRAGQLVTGPNTPLLRYTLRRDDPQQIADIQRLIRARTDSDHRILDGLADSRSLNAEEEFVARLTEASEGNFMYVSYVLADLSSRESTGEPVDLVELPVGLRGYYEQFWARMTAAPEPSWTDWAGLFQPVLERLAVAREPVTADWLGRQVGRPATEVRLRVLEPWTRVLGQARLDGTQAWRLVHRSFADFLDDKVDLIGANRAVAAHYCDSLWGRFNEWDDYGLRHVPAHLSEVARRTAEHSRHPAVAQLVRLVAEHRFQQTYLDRLRDPLSLRRDLEEAHRLTAKDPHPDATFLLVVIALTLLRFRRQMLQPSAVFDAARRGDLSTAERLLALFETDIDPDWHRAIELSLAWLAAPTAHHDALQLCDRVAAASPVSPNLQRLLAHVRATLENVPSPPGNLPAPATREQAEAMLVRLAGAGDSSLLAAHGLESTGELLGDGGYLATVDGPPLVALAQADPPTGDSVLGRYLDIHIAYGYRQYRNQSLWELLSAVLQHPQPEWVRDWLERLGVAVLAAPTRGEFLEGLEIAVLALKVIRGDTASIAALDSRRRTALEQVHALPPSPMRGQGDVWAIHKRRLAALAEAYTRLPGGGPTAIELVSVALGLAPGFAGFAAPASLTLAETSSVVAPDNTLWIDQALTAAEASAHNIQDATFCARTTARVTAMRERWWPAPTSLTAAIDNLVRDPSDPGLGATHIIGERYVHREAASRVQLPVRMVNAETLRDLADVYQRSLPEFQRFNEDLGPDDRLPAGTRVSVPDPGFPPLLAACLAAAVLTEGPPGAELSALVRHLVPIAGVDVTAQCTVLTRLLLCSPTDDAQLLEELHRLVRDTATATPDGGSQPFLGAGAS